VPIIKTKEDYYNPLLVIIHIEYDLIDNYYLDLNRIPFALYVNNKFKKEFFGNKVTVQLDSSNVASNIKIFALSHPGYRFDLNDVSPGDKIKVVFKSKKYGFYDVEKHLIYYDNKLGSYLNNPIGQIDAATGFGGGLKIEESKKLNKEEIRELITK
jgi:hypothetical protein